MPSSHRFSSILTIIYFDTCNKVWDSPALVNNLSVLFWHADHLNSRSQHRLEKVFPTQRSRNGQGKKSDHYLANDTAAFSQMSPSPLSHYILCRDSQQTLQLHLTSCYNIGYAYICTYIQTHTYYWDLQHTGVLCIGALALRRDFADCSQVRILRQACSTLN